MDKDKLAKLVAAKMEAAFNAGEHPKKFFITENGRGVVDGGDLYNAVLKDALDVMKVAMVNILSELMTPAPAPAAKAPEKATKASAKK